MVSARRLLLAICGLWLALAQSAIAAPDPGFRVFRIGNMDVAYADEIVAGRHDADENYVQKVCHELPSVYAQCLDAPWAFLF